MKKFIMIFLLSFLLTSCTVFQTKNLEIDNIVDKFLVKDERYNHSYSGYKFYLPLGYQILDHDNRAFKLSYKGENLYFFIDIVKYYYQSQSDYEGNYDAYYSKVLNKDNKKGYIEINKMDDGKYHLYINFNYGTVEAEIEEKNLKENLSNSLTLLSSIKYNKDIIKTMIDDKTKLSIEKQYEAKKENVDRESSDASYNSDDQNESEDKISLEIDNSV